jgi:hypothetical protein
VASSQPASIAGGLHELLESLHVPLVASQTALVVRNPLHVGP